MKEWFQLVHVVNSGVHSFRIDAVDSKTKRRRTQPSWHFTNRSIPLEELRQMAKAKLERLSNPHRQRCQPTNHSRVRSAVQELQAALKGAGLWP